MHKCFASDKINCCAFYKLSFCPSTLFKLETRGKWKCCVFHILKCALNFFNLDLYTDLAYFGKYHYL